MKVHNVLLKLILFFNLVIGKISDGIDDAYYPGRGCGLGTPYRYFLTEPDDKSLLKCAFVGSKFAHLSGGKIYQKITYLT